MPQLLLGRRKCSSEEREKDIVELEPEYRPSDWLKKNRPHIWEQLNKKGTKRKSEEMKGGMTPEEQTMYTTQLKRLGEIIVKRIADEIQKAKFLDVFPNLGALERLTDIEYIYKSRSEVLRQGTVTVDLENVIKELRQLEYELQRERMDKEQSNVIDYYEIELARYLSQVNKRFPEDTLPHLRPGEGKQLPDAAGPVGGKRKKSKKSKKTKKPKKTRKMNKSKNVK